MLADVQLGYLSAKQVEISLKRFHLKFWESGEKADKLFAYYLRKAR